MLKYGSVLAGRSEPDYLDKIARDNMSGFPRLYL
jgi:hypothetical protein